MNQTQNYTIACICGVDQSMTVANCVDVFTIKENNEPLFDVYFDYTLDGDEGDVEAKVIRLTAKNPCDLPFICNGIQLIGFVHDFLMNLIAEHGQEFFADAFVNEEGNAIELPITFAK